MCRPKEEGGRRCNNHNAFGVHIRNLQAKKQYHSKKGNINTVTEITEQMQTLRGQKNHLIEDGGRLLPYTMELTENAEKVLKQLQDDGYEPYIVGGSVRDALLKLDSKDVDIEVYKASPDEVVRSLKKIGQVDEVGKSFGVLKIRIGDEDFDVSLPRKDSKEGDGHRGFTVEVTPELSLTEATARRDFTINALMYNHELGYIIDKHGGLEDLSNKTLRHVSDAFDEDPLRVLRGVQMASRFDMVLHPETVRKAQTLENQFSDLAIERVQIEFQKLYSKGKAPHKAFQLLKDTRWENNFPGLAEANTKPLHRTLKRTQQLTESNIIPTQKTSLIVSASIASALSDEHARTFLAYTNVGDNHKNVAYNLSRVEAPQKQGKAALRHWARNLPRNITTEDWVLLTRAQGNKDLADRIQRKTQKLGIYQGFEKDFIDGDSVLALTDRKPGPWVREVLDAARNAQYADEFRSKESGLIWLKKRQLL